jgi:hypothetical protein
MRKREPSSKFQSHLSKHPRSKTVTATALLMTCAAVAGESAHAACTPYQELDAAWFGWVIPMAAAHEKIDQYNNLQTGGWDTDSHLFSIRDFSPFQIVGGSADLNWTARYDVWLDLPGTTGIAIWTTAQLSKNLQSPNTALGEANFSWTHDDELTVWPGGLFHAGDEQQGTRSVGYSEFSDQFKVYADAYWSNPYPPGFDGTIDSSISVKVDLDVEFAPQDFKLVCPYDDDEWLNPLNWANQAIPDGAGVSVGLYDDTNATVMNLSDSVTVGAIHFHHAPGFTVGGPGTLTIDNDGSNGQLLVTAGSATISAPVHLAQSTDFVVATGTALTLTNSMTAAAGTTVTKQGEGTLTLKHVRADGLMVALGKVVVAQNGGSSGTSKVTSLEIIEGSLDLKDNDLVVDYANTSPIGTASNGTYSGLTGKIQSGYNFTAWDGPGIVTSMADAQSNVGLTTLAIAEAADVLFLTGTDTAEWGGQTVDATTVLIKYTYAGDLNLDGQIDGADYGIIDNSIQFPGTDGYANGDINYDGVIDGADYGIIDNTAQFQGAPITTSAGPPGVGVGVVAVPEPASLVGGFLGAWLLVSRRRRRHS